MDTMIRPQAYLLAAVVDGDLMCHGAEPTYHRAKIGAMKAAGVITNE